MVGRPPPWELIFTHKCLWAQRASVDCPCPQRHHPPRHTGEGRCLSRNTSRPSRPSGIPQTDRFVVPAKPGPRGKRRKFLGSRFRGCDPIHVRSSGAQIRVWLRKMLTTSSRRRTGSTVLQVSNFIGGFADLACPEPAVAAVPWIPAYAGMTIMPVRAPNLITTCSRGNDGKDRKGWECGIGLLSPSRDDEERR